MTAVNPVGLEYTNVAVTCYFRNSARLSSGDVILVREAEAELAAGGEDSLRKSGAKPGGSQQPAFGCTGQRPDRERFLLADVAGGVRALEQGTG